MKNCAFLTFLLSNHDTHPIRPRSTLLIRRIMKMFCLNILKMSNSVISTYEKKLADIPLSSQLTMATGNTAKIVTRDNFNCTTLVIVLYLCHNVADGCWSRNVLATVFRCWWPIYYNEEAGTIIKSPTAVTSITVAVSAFKSVPPSDYRPSSSM